MQRNKWVWFGLYLQDNSSHKNKYVVDKNYSVVKNAKLARSRKARELTPILNELINQMFLEQLIRR